MSRRILMLGIFGILFVVGYGILYFEKFIAFVRMIIR